MTDYWLATSLPLPPSSGLWQLGCASVRLAPAFREPAHAAMILLAFPLTVAEWPVWRTSPLVNSFSGIAALTLFLAAGQGIWRWNLRAAMQRQRASGRVDRSHSRQ
jgi:hypothetical protein